MAYSARNRISNDKNDVVREYRQIRSSQENHSSKGRTRGRCMNVGMNETSRDVVHITV